MRLFNKAIDDKLFQQYRFGSNLSKQNVVAKIFNPTGNGTWFLLNSDPQDPDYLWAIVDLGYGAEVGSVSRNDLETYKGKFGLGFERDLSFSPINAEKLYNNLSEGKYYVKGGDTRESDTFQNIFENYGFTKGKSKYGLDMYYNMGYVASVDYELRNVDLMYEDEILYKGFKIRELLKVLNNQFQLTYKSGGALVGNQYKIDLNKNDGGDFQSGVYAGGGLITETTDAIFFANAKNGKIKTSFGYKTKEGLLNMLTNVNYDRKEIVDAIFDSNEKNGKINTGFGLKTKEGLSEMIKNMQNTFENGGNTFLLDAKNPKSVSGKSLTPLPKMNFSTNRGALISEKKFSKWLYDNALEEVKGDDYRTTLVKALNPSKLSVAEKDFLNLVLFDQTATKITYK